MRQKIKPSKTNSWILYFSQRRLRCDVIAVENGKISGGKGAIVVYLPQRIIDLRILEWCLQWYL